MAAVLVELESSFLDRGGSLGVQNSFDYIGQCIGACYVPLVLEPEVKKLLVAFHPHHICVSSLTERVALFRTTNRIVAFNTVLPAGMQTHWLLVLTEVNELFVLSMNKVSEQMLDLVVVQHFKFSDSLLGKKLAIDHKLRKKIVVSQKCFISVDETGRFIIIHSCRRFVVVLELKPSKREIFRSASANKIPLIVKKNPELASINKYKVFNPPDVYSIEDDMVVGMEIFHSIDANDEPLWWIASVMRNNKLEYDLSFYKLSTRRGGSLELHKRFLAEETYPNLIVPMSKFLILLFDTYHLICSLPGINIVVDNEQANMMVIENGVEFDETDGYLKQEVTASNGRNKFFKSHTVIDDKTVLLVTSSSEYYKIELDYEYIPYDSTTPLRTRSRDSPEANNLQNTLVWKKWEIKEAHELNSGRIKNLQVDQIFYTSETNSCFCINKHGETAQFLPGEANSLTQTYTAPVLKLPVTDLKITDQVNVSFTSGDLQKAFFKSPHFEVIGKNEIMKEHIFVNSFIVILTEAIVQDLSSSSSHYTTEKINVYQTDGKCIASYDLEENVTVSCMLPLRNLAIYHSDDNNIHREEVYDLERSLKNSFLVLTSSANGFDYDSDEDFLQRKRTEILLMVIKDESYELELKTISVLRSRIDCAEQISRKAFALWGVGSCFHLALQVYKDEEEGKKSSPELKFIKIREKLDLPINNISIVKELKDGFRLLVDPFFGVYLVRIAVDDSIKGIHELFEWNMITAIDVYSEDMFVAGDILGNIFLLNMDYTQGETPSCELFTCFNCTYGAIGCMSCYRPIAGKNKDSLLKLCSVGTSDGAIFSISVSDSVENPTFMKALKAQNRRTLNKNCFTFEQVAKNITVEKTGSRTVDPLEAYAVSEKLREGEFIKVSLASDNEVDELGKIIPVVFT